MGVNISLYDLLRFSRGLYYGGCGRSNVSNADVCGLLIGVISCWSQGSIDWRGFRLFCVMRIGGSDLNVGVSRMVLKLKNDARLHNRTIVTKPHTIETHICQIEGVLVNGKLDR